VSSSTDPRERVIQLGNQLLDALFEYESCRAAGEELRARLEAGHKMQSDEAKSIVMPLLVADQRLATAKDAYVTARGIVELYDGAEAKR